MRNRGWKRDSQGKITRPVTNKEAMRIAEVEDPGDCCGNCRYYDTSRGIRKPRCLKHPGLETVYISLCSDWEGKGEQDET